MSPEGEDGRLWTVRMGTVHHNGTAATLAPPACGRDWGDFGLRGRRSVVGEEGGEVEEERKCNIRKSKR